MATINFRPLHNRVVVRRVEAAEKTKGGIIIPDTAREKPEEGEILAVGTGVRDENGELMSLSVMAGDRVLFGKWSGTEVTLNGEDVLIMRETDILGVIGGDGSLWMKGGALPGEPGTDPRPPTKNK